MTPEAGATFHHHEIASPRLAVLVPSIWTLQYEGSVASLSGVVAPDGHVEFVFQTGAPMAMRSPAGELPTPRAMLFAQSRGAFQIVPKGANSLIALRVAPVVASAIVGRPLIDLWDRPIALGDLIGSEADKLVDALAAAPLLRRGRLLEEWLVSRLSGWSASGQWDLDLHETLFWQSRPLHSLCDTSGCTQRTLRRWFERGVGLSPKQFALTGRILRACAILVDRPEIPLVDVADMLGFNDQAAFANLFRQRVGMTPSTWRAEPATFVHRPAHC